jgi:hypothetical protein
VAFPDDTALKMIAEIWEAVNEGEDLSEWEDKFLTDVKGNLEFGLALTEKQDTKLVEIWKRVKGF